MKNNRAVFSALAIGFVLFTGSCGGNAGKVGPVNLPIPETAENALLADPKQGLDGLSSFHMRAVKEFTGEADGKPEQTKIEITGDMVRATRTEFVILKQSFAVNQVETILTGVIGDASYRRIGDENTACHLSWNPKTRAAPIVWPVDIVPVINAGEKVGDEEVNSVKTAHYKLDNSSLGETVFEKISGDLWLADPDGYVVKLELKLEGTEKSFGNGRSGVHNLIYELTRINANDDFAAPEGCLTVLDGVPIMADAEREYRLPGILRYYTPSSPENVLDFYTESLTEKGWQSGAVHETSNQGQVLLFVKPEKDDRLHLSLSKEDGETLVSVYVGKPSEIENKPTGANLEETLPPQLIDPAQSGLPEGVPAYPGVKNFSGIPGIKLEFTTADAVLKVMAFYKESLAKEKWRQLPGGTNIPEAPVMFMKDNIMLIIRAEDRNGETNVEIVVARQ